MSRLQASSISWSSFSACRNSRGRDAGGVHDSEAAHLNFPKRALESQISMSHLVPLLELTELPPWEDDTTFQQLLFSFGAILPLRKSSNLIDTKLRKRVLSLSEGVLVRICRLLESAAIAAIQSGVERIELGCLDDELGTQGLVSISDRRRRRVAG